MVGNRYWSLIKNTAAKTDWSSVRWVYAGRLHGCPHTWRSTTTNALPLIQLLCTVEQLSDWVTALFPQTPVTHCWLSPTHRVNIDSLLWHIIPHGHKAIQRHRYTCRINTQAYIYIFIYFFIPLSFMQDFDCFPMSSPSFARCFIQCGFVS